MKHSTNACGSFLILTVVLLFTSCKKINTTDEATVKSTLLLLQNKNWKLTALTVTPGSSGTGTEDVYNTSMEACEKDNIYRFNSGNVFILDEGLTKCDPADPQTENGTWDYNDATSTLHFQNSTSSDDYTLKIKSISETQLMANETENNGGVNYVYAWTFAKQ